MLGPLRYYGHLKLMNHASLAANSNALGQVIINLGKSRFPDVLIFEFLGNLPSVAP